MKLNEMITVRTGLVVTRKVSKDDKGHSYKQLTLKSFNAQCHLDVHELADFMSSSALDRRYLTQKGDVVLRLTWPYTAILIDEHTSGIVVTSNFMILRQDEQIFIPQYLHWLMNSKGIRRELERSSASEMMGSVRPQVVGEIPVILLSLEQQEKIGTLYALSLREQRLLSGLQKEKLSYHQRIIETAQSNMRKGIKL